jgi:hypothetical protein
MNTAATLLSSVLAGAPVSPTTSTTTLIETIEFERSDDSVQITARDAAGNVAAEVTEGEGECPGW